MCWIICRVSRLDKSKKATINSKTGNDRSFQYASTFALNFEGIKKEPQRFSDIKPFINKYNSDAIKYSSKIDDCKNFEKNNSAIPSKVCRLKKWKHVQLRFQKLI